MGAEGPKIFDICCLICLIFGKADNFRIKTYVFILIMSLFSKTSKTKLVSGLILFSAFKFIY